MTSSELIGEVNSCNEFCFSGMKEYEEAKFEKNENRFLEKQEFEFIDYVHVLTADGKPYELWVAENRCILLSKEYIRKRKKEMLKELENKNPITAIKKIMI